MSSHLLTKNPSSRSLNLNKSFLLSIFIHLLLIFGITFTTFYKLPILNNTPIINVKLANSNVDEFGSELQSTAYLQENIYDLSSAGIPKEQKGVYQPHKIKKLEADSLVNSAEAQYLNLWQRQIETAGDKIILENGANYQDARVQIIATVDSLGNLIKSDIVISSGIEEIDILAMRILNESAPFPAFDPMMIEEYGFLEIVRDWNFSSN